MFGSMALVLVSTASAVAQDGGSSYPSDAMNVAIAVRAGATLSTPRGDFPSVIVRPSKRGTGTIDQTFGASGTGSRFEINALIPVANAFGISLGIGTQSIAVDYAADTSRLATHFALQTVQGLVGVQWSIFNEPSSYVHGGLRSVYVDGGFDFGIGMLANRVESSSYDDTLSTLPKPAIGSFDSAEPFRNVVALRGAVGLRFAPTPNLELSVETSYSYALNPMFSSEAIDDNDFSVDVLGAVFGLGYRF